MLRTQLKEHHLLFIVSFVFTRDRSSVVNRAVSVRSAESFKRPRCKVRVLHSLRKTDSLMSRRSARQWGKSQKGKKENVSRPLGIESQKYEIEIHNYKIESQNYEIESRGSQASLSSGRC